MTFFMRLVNRISQLEGELRKTQAERDHYRQIVQQHLHTENEERSTWVDPDDAPEWTDEMFERADLYHGGKLVRRGRPPSTNPKLRTDRTGGG
jgi:hypothetical protein